MIQTALAYLPVAYVVATAVPLMVMNVKQHRLPNKIVVPMTLVTLLSQLTLAVWQGSWPQLGMSVLTGIVVMVVGITINYKGWIGMGDVKLFTALTMIISWFSPLWGALMFPVTILIAIVIGAINVLLNKRRIQMGPTLLATFAVVLTLATR